MMMFVSKKKLNEMISREVQRQFYLLGGEINKMVDPHSPEDDKRYRYQNHSIASFFQSFAQQLAETILNQATKRGAQK